MRASRLLLVVGSWLASALPAQDPATAPTLTLQNLARTPRKEGAAVVVPFAPGAVRELPALHVPDTPTCWQPFGARWPDGSLRQALCLFVAEVPAGGERSVALAPGPGPALPTGPIAVPAAKLVFVATVGGAVVRAEPQRVADLEANALRRVELRRARLGHQPMGVLSLRHAAVKALGPAIQRRRAPRCRSAGQ
jgi:hypothetical protein